MQGESSFLALFLKPFASPADVYLHFLLFFCLKKKKRGNNNYWPSKTLIEYIKRRKVKKKERERNKGRWIKILENNTEGSFRGRGAEEKDNFGKWKKLERV